MKEFMEKWQSDKQFQTKIKLLLFCDFSRYLFMEDKLR